MGPRLFAALVVMAAGASPLAAAFAWVRARTAHVEVLTDGSEEQARRAAAQLEVFHRVLQAALRGVPGLLEDRRPPLVLAFRGDESYARYLPLRNGEPQEADGFILGGGDRMAIAVNLGTADPGEALAHEYTHYALSPVLPAQPAWLGEGLAQLLAAATVWPDAASLGRPSEAHLRRIRAGAMPLRELLAVGYLSPTYEGGPSVAGGRRGLFYAQSWALAHWIVAGGHGGLPAVMAFGEEVAAGDDEETAFRRAFGMTVETADAALAAYLAAAPLPTLSVPVATAAERVDVSPVDGAAMDATLGDLLMREGRTADARSHFERALRGGAAAAHEGLAGLLLREGKLEEAQRHVEAALAADPADPRALQRRAEHLIREVARRGDVLSDADTDRAVAVLERALAANPDLADAADLLARLRPAPLAQRIALLRRAVARQPERTDLAFTLAALYARQNDLQQAARVLRRARERTRDDTQRFLSDHLLARVGAVASGQTSARGTLEAVECLPGGALAFRVRTASGLLRLAAESPKSVFLFDTEGEAVERDLTCGPASAPVTARYLTGPPGAATHRLLSLTFDRGR